MSEVVSYTLTEVAMRLGIGFNLKVAAARLSLDGRFLELRVEDARNIDVEDARNDEEAEPQAPVMLLAADIVPVTLSDVVG